METNSSSKRGEIKTVNKRGTSGGNTPTQKKKLCVVGDRSFLEKLSKRGKGKSCSTPLGVVAGCCPATMYCPTSGEIAFNPTRKMAK